MAHFETVEEFTSYLQSEAANNEEFRSRLLSDPNSVVESELGVTIPDGFKVCVHEDSAMTANLVIPPSDSLSEEDLLAVAGGIKNIDFGDWA